MTREEKTDRVLKIDEIDDLIEALQSQNSVETEEQFPVTTLVINDRFCVMVEFDLAKPLPDTVEIPPGRLLKKFIEKHQK